MTGTPNGFHITPTDPDDPHAEGDGWQWQLWAHGTLIATGARTYPTPRDALDSIHLVRLVAAAAAQHLPPDTDPEAAMRLLLADAADLLSTAHGDNTFNLRRTSWSSNTHAIRRGDR